MAERVRFYFDPICPWCYQTSRWARRLEELGVLELDWGVFSLELQNRSNEPEDLARAHARSERELRTAIAVRDHAGPTGVGAFYEQLGARVHQLGEPLEDSATVTGALRDAGLAPEVASQAMEDDSTLERVATEHRALCDRTRSFGVPTIVLDAGDGPAIFGPVIVEVPDDDDAVALWEHVSWLVRHDSFAELKRERDRAPELESVRRRQQRQAERAAS
ncbi:Rv2466c family mycothiol-dependent reductase [soil metagenome]